jgi:hypothetical protein
MVMVDGGVGMKYQSPSQTTAATHTAAANPRKSTARRQLNIPLPPHILAKNKSIRYASVGDISRRNCRVGFTPESRRCSRQTE